MELDKYGKKIMDRVLQVLLAAVPEDQWMAQLESLLQMLQQASVKEAVLCGSWCSQYNLSLCSALLTAANTGRHAAIPPLAEVFRYKVCFVLSGMADNAPSDPSHLQSWLCPVETSATLLGICALTPAMLLH